MLQVITLNLELHFSLFLYLFLIKMYEENAILTSSALVIRHRLLYQRVSHNHSNPKINKLCSFKLTFEVVSHESLIEFSISLIGNDITVCKNSLSKRFDIQLFFSSGSGIYFLIE